MFGDWNTENIGQKITLAVRSESNTVPCYHWYHIWKVMIRTQILPMGQDGILIKRFANRRIPYYDRNYTSFYNLFIINVVYGKACYNKTVWLMHQVTYRQYKLQYNIKVRTNFGFAIRKTISKLHIKIFYKAKWYTNWIYVIRVPLLL